jgi:CheY-like chemotaxis protein
MTQPPLLPRVLVVDDEEAVCTVLNFFLKKDFSVETESSWERAVEKITSNAFDLVVTDLMMPNSPRHVILNAVKTKDPTIPVAIISGLSENDELVRTALAAGANTMIPKPFEDRATVLATLKALLHPKN